LILQAELDPHVCSPVEILHVFLLGVVKYMWRDAVGRLTTAERHILKIRLQSLDVHGLGLSPLKAQTLVQYAGSLTGGDFRAIAQVGVLVLFDLLPEGLVAMWAAMGRLAPLIYQPRIENLPEYLVSSIPYSYRLTIL
jgi:hypothetical protein